MYGNHALDEMDNGTALFNSMRVAGGLDGYEAPEESRTPSRENDTYLCSSEPVLLKYL